MPPLNFELSFSAYHGFRTQKSPLRQGVCLHLARKLHAPTHADVVHQAGKEVSDRVLILSQHSLNKTAYIHNHLPPSNFELLPSLYHGFPLRKRFRKTKMPPEGLLQLSGATLCALCLGAHDRRFTRLRSDSGSQARPH